MGSFAVGASFEGDESVKLAVAPSDERGMNSVEPVSWAGPASERVAIALGAEPHAESAAQRQKAKTGRLMAASHSVASPIVGLRRVRRRRRR